MLGLGAGYWVTVGFFVVACGLFYAAGWHKGRDSELDRWQSRVFGLDQAVFRAENGNGLVTGESVRHVLMMWADGNEVKLNDGSNNEQVQ